MRGGAARNAAPRRLPGMGAGAQAARRAESLSKQKDAPLGNKVNHTHLDFPDDEQAINNAAKHDVFAVQELCLAARDVELCRWRPVGAGWPINDVSA